MIMLNQKKVTVIMKMKKKSIKLKLIVEYLWLKIK